MSTETIDEAYHGKGADPVRPLRKVLEGMEMPGDFIVLGRDSAERNDIAILGRVSIFSNVRRFYIRGGEQEGFRVDSFNAKSHLDSFAYDFCAVLLPPYKNSGIMLGNGDHVSYIFHENPSAIDDVSRVLKGKLTYQDTYHTARIAGFIKLPRDGRRFDTRLGLGIVRDINGPLETAIYDYQIYSNRGYMIATYDGDNTSTKLYPFTGSPVAVKDIAGKDIRTTAVKVYEAFAPQGSRWDYRNGVVVVYSNTETGVISVAIKNKGLRMQEFRYMPGKNPEDRPQRMSTVEDKRRSLALKALKKAKELQDPMRTPKLFIGCFEHHKEL